MSYTLSIGSVSSGTMRTEDLLDAFSWGLEQIRRRSSPQDDCGNVVKLLGENNVVQASGDFDTEEASELVNDMMDELNEWCPPHTYFGSHEGDAADYGCWPSFGNLADYASDNDIPMVDDPCELDTIVAEYSEAFCVNDHGNVTLYVRRDSLNWEIVWAVV